jgi:hypothetical protein
MNWPVGSVERSRVIENPAGADLYRLIARLGLEWYDPAVQSRQLATRLRAG